MSWLTALKGGVASPESVEAMVRSMTFLNKIASEIAVNFSVRACTDVTGFGLKVIWWKWRVQAHATSNWIPCWCRFWMARSESASMGLVPAGAHANRDFFGSWITLMSTVSLERQDLMFDPQTSGGLVLGIPADRATEFRETLTSAGIEIAAEVGEVLDHNPEGHLEIV